MRSARLLVCIVAITGGVAAGFVLVPRALHGLHALTFPTLATPGPHATGTRRSPNHGAGHHSERERLPAARQAASRTRDTAGSGHRRTGSFALLARVAKLIAAGLALLVAASLLLAVRRARHRRTREYALYELHLSTHDQAKGQDLEDMVESIANIVRAWPADRVRNGQPYFALELICGTRRAPAAGWRWSGRSTSAASRDRSARSTARSAPPTPTSGSAARTASSPAHAPACCASPAT